jgi:hypothetical protein
MLGSHRGYAEDLKDSQQWRRRSEALMAELEKICGSHGSVAEDLRLSWQCCRSS